MVVNVWLSIQSDFGITMGEMGRLSSETDSKLIASTLTALKDIVAVEASSGESQFMTGSVETSSFGTFAIAIDDQSKLIMSYVISADIGSTVNQSTVNLAQAICTNMGKQLTQFGFISNLATSGQSIHRSTLIQSFLNACTVVKLEKKIANDKRVVRKGIQQTVLDLLENHDELLELYDYIMGMNWKTDDDKWSAGFLTKHQQEYLIEGLAYHIVYLLANERPLGFLYSPDPRNEYLRIKQILQKEISSRTISPHKRINKILDKTDEAKIKKFIEKLPTAIAHSYESHVFRHFVRKAFLTVIKHDPLAIFSDPNRKPIRDKFHKILPNLEVEHVGSIMTRALKPVSGEGLAYVDTFFKGFIDGMYEVPITKPAMDIMVGFSQQFIENTELAQAIKNLEDVKRKSEITKLISTGEIKQLRIGSIEEAVRLTNAGSNAVVNVLAQIIIDQFLFNNGSIGLVVQDLIGFYRKSGPVIKTAQILVSLMELLTKTNYETELTTPLERDFLVAALRYNGYKMRIGETSVSLKQKDGYVIIQGGQISKTIKESINDKDEIIVDLGGGREITIGFDTVDAQAFINLVDNVDILIEGIGVAIDRRFSEVIAGSIDSWVNNAGKIVDKLASAIENEQHNASTILSQSPRLPTSPLGNITLGVDIAEKLTKISEEIQNQWKTHITKEFEKISDEAQSKGQVNKKSAKKLTKAFENFAKSIERIKKNLAIQLETIKKDVLKVMKVQKDDLKDILQPKREEIMKFNYESQDFLPQADFVIDELKEFAESTEGLRDEDYERLILNVSLSLFENPPDSVFEPAYNEVISGKRSNSIKKALNDVKTKKEFEQVLRDQGQLFESNIYEGLSQLINQVNHKYIDADGIVTSDGGRIYLHIGRIPLTRYPRQTLIEKVLNYPRIKFSRETDSWLVTFEIYTHQKAQSEDETIVTFEDAVRFYHKHRFDERTQKVFQALSKVAALIEAKAGGNIMNTSKELKSTIYSV